MKNSLLVSIILLCLISFNGKPRDPPGPSVCAELSAERVCVETTVVDTFLFRMFLARVFFVGFALRLVSEVIMNYYLFH